MPAGRAATAAAPEESEAGGGGGPSSSGIPLGLLLVQGTAGAAGDGPVGAGSSATSKCKAGAISPDEGLCGAVVTGAAGGGVAIAFWGVGVCAARGGGAGSALIGGLFLERPPLSAASPSLPVTGGSCLGLMLLPWVAAAEEGGAVEEHDAVRGTGRGCEAGCRLDSAGRLPPSKGGARSPPADAAAATDGSAPEPSGAGEPFRRLEEVPLERERCFTSIMSGPM